MPRLLLYISLMSTLTAACREDFDLYAPAEDIYVVYGVLDPGREAQYVRVSQVFQIEADAIAYAASHDPGVSGLQLTLTGGGEHYTAVWVPQLTKDTLQGDFGPLTSGYRFETAGAKRLVPGERYTLRITSPADTGLLLTAYTRIPPRPAVIFPNYTWESGRRCLRRLPFEDSVEVRFRTNPEALPTQAYRYELRVALRYWADGKQHQHHFGPTRLFARSYGCSGFDNHTLCYKLAPRQVLNSLRTAMQTPGVHYEYDAEPRCSGVVGPLSRAVEVQVTAVDTFLGRYILANAPYFRNLNPIRQEYTNLSGTARAVGVFGAIAYDNRPVALTACGEYLVGLREARPPGCE